MRPWDPLSLLFPGEVYLFTSWLGGDVDGGGGYYDGDDDSGYYGDDDDGGDSVGGGGGYDLIVGFWGHEEVLFPCQIAPRFNIQYCRSKYSMKEQPIWYVVIVLLAPNNIFQTLDGGGAPLFGCPIVSIEVLLSNLPPLPTTAIDQENMKSFELC